MRYLRARLYQRAREESTAQGGGGPQVPGRHRRAGGEDPHPQLPRRSRHQTPRQHDGAPTAGRARGKPGSVRGRAARGRARGSARGRGAGRRGGVRRCDRPSSSAAPPRSSSAMRSTAPGRPRRSSWRMSSEPIGRGCMPARPRPRADRSWPSTSRCAGDARGRRSNTSLATRRSAADARGASGRVHSAPGDGDAGRGGPRAPRGHIPTGRRRCGDRCRCHRPGDRRRTVGRRRAQRPISRRRPWSSRDAMPTGSACGSRFTGDTPHAGPGAVGPDRPGRLESPYVALDRMDDLPAEVRANQALRSPATSRSTSGWPSRPRTRCARAAASRSRSQRIAAGMSPT